MMYARPINRDWELDRKWVTLHTGMNNIEANPVLMGWESDNTKLHIYVFPGTSNEGLWTETLTPRPPWCSDPNSEPPAFAREN